MKAGSGNLSLSLSPTNKINESTSTISWKTLGPKLGSDVSNPSDYADYIYHNELLGDMWPEFEPFEPEPPRFFCYYCDTDCKSEDLMHLHYKNNHVSLSCPNSYDQRIIKGTPDAVLSRTFLRA